MTEPTIRYQVLVIVQRIADYGNAVREAAL
jgi:hypothetical protein